ncbi:unnamed protein product, partial [Ilex paraguariensis]
MQAGRVGGHTVERLAGQVSRAVAAAIHVGRVGCASWQSRANRLGALAVLSNGSSWKALVQELGAEDAETEM